MLPTLRDQYRVKHAAIFHLALRWTTAKAMDCQVQLRVRKQIVASECASLCQLRTTRFCRALLSWLRYSLHFLGRMRHLVVCLLREKADVCAMFTNCVSITQVLRYGMVAPTTYPRLPTVHFGQSFAFLWSAGAIFSWCNNPVLLTFLGYCNKYSKNELSVHLS